MLVKFISYVITVFGTKRYKPVLFACVALFISLAGIAGANSIYQQSGNPAAASKAGDNETAEDTVSSEAISKQGLRFEDTSKPQTVTPETTENAAPNNGTTAPANEATKDPFTLIGNETLTVSKSDTAKNQATINLATSDNTAVHWSANLDSKATGLKLDLTTTEASGNIVFLVKVTDASQVQAGTYSLTVSAKDNVRGVIVTKILSITVQAQ